MSTSMAAVLKRRSQEGRALKGARRRGCAAWSGWVLLLLLLAALPYLGLGDFLTGNVTLVFVYAVAILGLDLLTGEAGQVSLGHGGLMGLGAYVTALLVLHTGASLYWTLLVAPFAAAVLGLVFAVCALRLSGLYLALATFALALAVPQAAVYFTSLTRGEAGLSVPTMGSPIAQLSAENWLYYLCLVFSVWGLIASRLIVTSRVGRALHAVRDNAYVATACGIRVSNVKIFAFTVSAMYAGVAGALLAIANSFVSPTSVSFTLSLSLFVSLGIAGYGAPISALFAGVIMVYLPLESDRISSGFSGIVYGGVIVVLVLVGRGGLVDLLIRARDWGRLRVMGTGRRTGGNTSPEPKEMLGTGASGDAGVRL